MSATSVVGRWRVTRPGDILGGRRTVLRFTVWLVVVRPVRLTVRYTDAGNGWVTAQVAEIPAAISQGRTRAEALENVVDALQVVLTSDRHFA